MSIAARDRKIVSSLSINTDPAILYCHLSNRNSLPGGTQRLNDHVSALGPGCVKTPEPRPFAQLLNPKGDAGGSSLRLRSVSRINVSSTSSGNSFYTAWVRKRPSRSCPKSSVISQEQSFGSSLTTLFLSRLRQRTIEVLIRIGSERFSVDKCVLSPISLHPWRGLRQIRVICIQANPEFWGRGTIFV